MLNHHLETSLPGFGGESHLLRDTLAVSVLVLTCMSPPEVLPRLIFSTCLPSFSRNWIHFLLPVMKKTSTKVSCPWIKKLLQAREDASSILFILSRDSESLINQLEGSQQDDWILGQGFACRRVFKTFNRTLLCPAPFSMAFL